MNHAIARPLSALCLAGLCATAQAEVLLMDDFAGAALAPAWAVEQGFAAVAGGQVDVYGSTPGTRDGWIVANEGADGAWSNYHFATRFLAEGGSGWYHGDVAFRVQDWQGWTSGTFYRLLVDTPLWSGGPGLNGGGTVSLGKVANGVYSTLVTTSPSPGIVGNRDNAIDVWAAGSRLQVAINGTQLIDVVDGSPILTGGVALGAIWESHVRYDYAVVATLPAPIPEPQSWTMIALGAGALGWRVWRQRGSTRG